MVSALGHDFVGFLAVFGRHNIRCPHFASKVSYSAAPQTFAECSRSASCCYVATPFGSKPRRDLSGFWTSKASGEGFLQTKVVQLPKMTKQSGRFLHAAHCKNEFGQPMKRF